MDNNQLKKDMILKAIKNRVREARIKYGNEITDDIKLDIEREIVSQYAEWLDELIGPDYSGISLSEMERRLRTY